MALQRRATVIPQISHNRRRAVSQHNLSDRNKSKQWMGLRDATRLGNGKMIEENSLDFSRVYKFAPRFEQSVQPRDVVQRAVGIRANQICRMEITL